MGDHGTVAIVVDPAFSDLAKLLDEMPVWIVDTPTNRANVEKLWPSVKQRWPSIDRLTIYQVSDSRNRENNCLDEVDAVELHHPDATTLFLVGLENTPSLRAGFEELGYGIEITGPALIARRLAANPPTTDD